MSNSKVWITSDLHFNHAKIQDFSPSRQAWGDNIQEMNHYMVEQWIATVRAKDTVWVLGDVCFGQESQNMELLKALPGYKKLVLGNHDKPWIHKYFDVVYGVQYLRKGVATHIPVHPNQLVSRFKYNFHGHMHESRVELNGEIDRRYINVCVEHHGGAPVLVSDLTYEYSKIYEASANV